MKNALQIKVGLPSHVPQQHQLYIFCVGVSAELCHFLSAVNSRYQGCNSNFNLSSKLLATLLC